MFCIPKHLTQIFLEKVKSGEINPEKMASMTSKERRDYFTTFLGEANAKQVNALFESKLLLQHQKQGIINWAKQVSGLKPEVQRDIVSRVNKMTEVLTPENEKSFLEDLAAHKLGVTVTMEEAGNIASLAKDVAEKKSEITKGGDRLDYGRAKVAFDDYVNGLKESNKSVLEYFKPTNIAGLAKSLKASLDNSVIGRQGLKVLLTHPEVWLKNSFQSFKDIWDTFGGKEVVKEVRADILSRPNALNGLYKKEGLAVGVNEEAYPTNLPEKLPVLGKAFKASEQAFTAFQYRTRADVFDKYVEMAEKNGGETKGLGILANSLTGRGSLGATEKNLKVINNIFFSPRFLKSNIDTLTAHNFLFNDKLGNVAKKQAAINSLKIIGSIATVLMIAKAVNKDSVELDPRSADFGKIKIGDTRFDVSGGMASILTLAMRIVTHSSKSSVTGLLTDLDSGKFGAQTKWDVLLNFLANKASPAASVGIDIAKGKDRQGNKPTVAGEASNLLLPLPIANYEELKNNPKSADVLLAMIADELGIATNTYGFKIDWTQSEGKELKQFSEKIGDKDFAKSNQEFNTKFSNRIQEIQKSDEFKNLSDDDKTRLLTKEKDKIKESIFKEYGFHYKKERSSRLPNI